MITRPRLGLIGTGQGPRPEYIAFHRGLLRSLGVEADVVMRNALGDVQPSEIEELTPKAEEAAIHAYVRCPGATNKRFGPDWGEAWMERGRTIPLVQACIDALEKEHGVDAIIYCCAEAYPEDAFRSAKPVVMPYRVVLGYAEAVARLRGGQAVIGVLIGHARQRAQQLDMWRRYPWAADVKLQLEELDVSPLEAAQRLAHMRPDLIIYWGYGIDLAPSDPPGLIHEMQSILGQPIILHHVVSTLFVRNFLCPPINGRDYVKESSL